MKLVYEKQDDIGFIILANPPKNTLTRPDFEDPAKLKDFLETPSFKGVIVKGEGRHFSQGADLGSLNDYLKSSKEPFENRLNKGKDLLDILSSSTVPVVAVIKGSCLGAGLEIALACHFRFASFNALIGFPESDRGLIPGFSGTLRAPGLMGRGRAIELILSGRMIIGSEALEYGLVDKVFETGDVEREAVEFIQQITLGRSQEVIRAVMTALDNSRKLDRKTAMSKETELFIKLARAQHG